MDKGTLRKLNSRLLFQQNLSRPARGATPLVTVSDSCCGINSQNFRDSYMSFWSRSSGFTEEKLNSSIGPGGTLSRTWTVRGTVHTFPTKDYSVYVFGSPVERYLNAHDRYARQLGLPNREGRIRLLYEPLLDEMGNEKVSTDFVISYISTRLEEMGIKSQRHLSRGWSTEKILGPIWEGVTEMSYMGLLSNAGRKGSGNLWMSTKHWLGSELKEPDFEESASKLVKKYIEKYGPVTLKDIAYWTGHKIEFLKKILEKIRPEIQYEKNGGSSQFHYFVEKMDEDIPRPPSAIILPRFDSLIMGYSDKSRFLNPQFKDVVSAKAGVIKPTILLDGFVQGIWTKEKRGRSLRITVAQFRKFPQRSMKAVERKFTRFADHENLNLELKFREINS